jgi:group II intron reverse transcriptase/maturase
MTDLWRSFIDPDNMWNAWEAVRRRSAGAGVDGRAVADFAPVAPDAIDSLRRELRRGSYIPQPLLGVFIAKPAGGWRRVGIPAVRDRIAQRACLDVLQPLLDAQFEECSYAYRPGRSIAHALGRIERWRDSGHRYLFESDIENCFDSIDRAQLIVQLARFVPDKRLLDLIGTWLEAGTVWRGRGGTPPQLLLEPRGIAQGSVLSPLLCNLFLDSFDEALLAQKFKLVRYADDFVIVATRAGRTQDAQAAAATALAALGLKLHPTKTRLSSFDQGFKYLGTTFQGDMMLTAERFGSGYNGYPEPPRLAPRLQKPHTPPPPQAPAPSADAVGSDSDSGSGSNSSDGGGSGTALATALAKARLHGARPPLMAAFEKAWREKQRTGAKRARAAAAEPDEEGSYLV